MARKVRKIQDPSSDDDAPEVVSHLASKADAKRNQKALHNFEAEEKARKKTRNRERDQKLKERARVTRGGEKEKQRKGLKFVDHSPDGEDEGESDDVETRMLRAMRDAENEVDSDEREEDEFRGFEREMELGDETSSSDASFVQDRDDEDVSGEDSDLIDSEASTDDEMDEDAKATSSQVNIQKSSWKANYLADDLFAAAFASQNSKPLPEKHAQASQRKVVKKRRQKFIARPKDLIVGDRVIRTLPRPSDPRSQATAWTVPSARARRFLNHSLAMKGKQALLKAKKRGWERRPANVGVMKYQGAPHGFARGAR